MSNIYENWWNGETSSAREVRSSFDRTALRAAQDQMDAIRSSMYQSMMAAPMSFLGYDTAVADAIKETKQNKNKKLLLCKI